MKKHSFNGRGFSLTFRLSLGITLLITILMGIVGISTYLRDQRVFMQEAISRGWNTVRIVNKFAADYILKQDYSLLGETVESLVEDGFVIQATVFDADGKVLADSGVKTAGWLDNSEQVVESIKTKQAKMVPVRNSSGKTTALAFTAPITGEAGDIYGYFSLAADFSFVAAHLQQTGYNILIMFVLASIGGLLLTRLIIMRSVYRPVKELLKATERISVGDFSGKLQVLANDELGLLANAFNTMSDQLGKLFNTIRNTIDKMSDTSSFIVKQSDIVRVDAGAEINEERQIQLLKEINGNAKRLSRLSSKLNTLALQFRIEP